MAAAYLNLLNHKLFENKIRIARKMLDCCRVCPRYCEVDRNNNGRGKCGVGKEALVSSHFPHFGEESVLVGRHGSGTIFMGGCNLQCLFCQNYELSHNLEGHEVTAERLAEMMLELQEAGCHNINIVTPSHVVPQLLEALYLAAQEGLTLPMVYNSSGYDSPETLRLLEGIVDIYMPDFKYYSDEAAARYTVVKDYGSVARRALQEMHRQVGNLRIEGGLAVRGLLVRHLVMPGGLEESKKIFRFLAEEISPHTFVNVMAQYHPAGHAHLRPEISRRLIHSEFTAVMEAARSAGLYRFSD